jgi:hypothetical protein
MKEIENYIKYDFYYYICNFYILDYFISDFLIISDCINFEFFNNERK